MKYSVKIGTQNPVKISATEEVLKEYITGHFCLEGQDVESEVNEQPQSFSETLQGACNRARNAFTAGCSFSIGLEDGIFAIPGTERSYMNICICAIFNGQNMHYGTSSAFEYPTDITDLVTGRGLDISEALGAAGYTGNPNIGSNEGAIGLLSKGKLIRKDYTKQALNAAFIHLENLMEYPS